MAFKKQHFAEGEIPIFDEACIYKPGEYWQFHMWLPKENKYAHKRFGFKAEMVTVNWLGIDNSMNKTIKETISTTFTRVFIEQTERAPLPLLSDDLVLLESGLARIREGLCAV